MDSNTITNSGTITVGSRGISLYSGAYAQKGDDNDADQRAFALSTLNYNTITNSGTITAGNQGIRIYSHAVASAFEWSSDADSYAEVINNKITNSGTITADAGIVIKATAESYVADNAA